MRKLIFLLTSLFLFHEGNAQQLFLDWVKETESQSFESFGQSVSVNSHGSFFVLHRCTYGGQDLDPSIGVDKVYSKKKADAFITKFDSAGKYMWTQTLVDSLHSNMPLIASSSKYCYLGGSMKGAFNPNFRDSADHLIVDYANTSRNFILKYEASTGDFVKALVFDPNVGASSIKSDKNGRLWVSGTYNGITDLDPNLNKSIMTQDENGAFVLCLNDEDSVLYEWHSKMGLVQFKDFSFSNNNVMVMARLVKTKPSGDTIVFNQDSLIITGTKTAYFIFDKQAQPYHFLTTNNSGAEGALVATLADDELLFTTERLYTIQGIIDSFVNQPFGHISAWKYNLVNKQYVFEDRTIPIHLLGKWKGDYIVLDDTMNFKVLDSATNQIKFSFSPSVVKQGFQTPTYGAINGHLYTYGGVRGKLNFGTDSWPILITDGTENAGSSDLYLGMFSNTCKPIVDSTKYLDDVIQCKFLSMERQVDIRGSGLKLRWVNESLKRKMDDAEGFDGPNGIAQFIRGSTSDFFRYQWDVEEGAIPGKYRVHVEDACGNSFISKPIVVGGYGKPDVKTGTVNREYIIGDTFKMWALPDVRFDTLKYAWVKDEFFLFDWGPIQGTADTLFSIKGLEGEHSGMYRLVSFHPYCPDYFSESVPFPLYINTNDTLNNDWLSTKKLIKNANELLYPNPSRGDFSLDLSGVKVPVELWVIQPDGKLLFKKIVLNERVVMDATAWSSGIYLVQIKLNNQSYTFKWNKL